MTGKERQTGKRSAEDAEVGNLNQIIWNGTKCRKESASKRHASQTSSTQQASSLESERNLKRSASWSTKKKKEKETEREEKKTKPDASRSHTDEMGENKNETEGIEGKR